MKKILYVITFASIVVSMGTITACKDDEIKKLYRKVPKPEYTREAPDEWAGLEDTHLPIVEFYRDREPDILVRVKLPNPTTLHYIEKIGIMDENRRDIVSKEFRSVDKNFEARFFSATIPKDRKNLKVYAKCSLHDLWVEPFNIPE